MRGNENQYFVLEEIRLPVKQQQTYTINIHDDWIKNKSIKKNNGSSCAQNAPLQGYTLH